MIYVSRWTKKTKPLGLHRSLSQLKKSRLMINRLRLLKFKGSFRANETSLSPNFRKSRISVMRLLESRRRLMKGTSRNFRLRLEQLLMSETKFKLNTIVLSHRFPDMMSRTHLSKSFTSSLTPTNLKFRKRQPKMKDYNLN